LRRAHEGRPARKGAHRRERKYVTERRGRGKENSTMARTMTAGRMSRVGRPPRLGFGAKRSVLRARVEKGRIPGNWLGEPYKSQYRERAGRSLRRGMVAAFGYLRRVKRMRMEEIREGEGKRARRQRKVGKEGARRRGRVRRRRTVAWRNGEGVERRRERIGRVVMKRVR
jgi:NADH:ubiquinone oxidoreductase subunit 2 (subunit N)